MLFHENIWKDTGHIFTSYMLCMVTLYAGFHVVSIPSHNSNAYFALNHTKGYIRERSLLYRAGFSLTLGISDKY